MVELEKEMNMTKETLMAIQHTKQVADQDKETAIRQLSEKISSKVLDAKLYLDREIPNTTQVMRLLNEILMVLK